MKNSCRQYGLLKYKRQIERDEEIAEELQDGNKSAKLKKLEKKLIREQRKIGRASCRERV